MQNLRKIYVPQYEIPQLSSHYGRFFPSTLWQFPQKAFFQVGILKGMCQNWAKSSWNGNSSRPGPYQFATLITSKNPGFTPNFRGFQCNNYASKEHTRFNRKMDGDQRK